MKKLWLMSGLVVLSLLLLACSGNDESTAGTQGNSGGGSTIATLGDADLDTYLKANAGKPTLMIFWATWCPSCKQALPEMEGLAMSHGDKANIVAVSLDEKPAALENYLEKNPLQVPVFLGDQKLAARFGIEAIPTLVIFDKAGKQIFAKAGAFPLSMLQKVVDDLTAGQLMIRKARIADVKVIHSLLMHNEEHDGLVLPRSFSQLYSHLRDFFVAVDDEGRVVGCCGLNIIWDNLAEIRSLVVVPEHRGRKLGRKLVEAALSEAVTLGIYSVYTLTEQAGFFTHLGFTETAMNGLNQKVFADCLNCPRFPDHCNEVAMVLELQPNSEIWDTS
eukprot:TRINITY_DN9592_c0_g1_i3.p2 TRINITY_DN9592_c0_g1~~TRINITY_DN9592_c0_g1_i3.p2  ORF type:complete len:333 (+),score=130.40 TRINITY_DN9592_c0_g1_i3:174-1172(+)